MEKYLAPGAIDGFLGAVDAMEEDDNNTENQQGMFDVPHELLVTMPIAQVTPGTVIIPVNNKNKQKKVQANPLYPTPPEPTPGPSNVQGNCSGQGQPIEYEAMEVEPVVGGPEPRQANEIGGGKPKKGYNVKNKKKTIPPGKEESADDDTLPARMEMLKELLEVMRNRTGPRRSEMELWGNYMGAKAERIPEGRIRDHVLLFVERNMNKAIHGEWNVEE